MNDYGKARLNGNSFTRFKNSVGSSASETEKLSSASLSSVRFCGSIGSSASDHSRTESLGDKVFGPLPSMPRFDMGAKSSGRRFCLNDFCMGRKLGQGRFGFVHISKEKQSGKKVALKIMWKKDLEEEDLLGQGKHRNLLTISLTNFSFHI